MFIEARGNESKTILDIFRERKTDIPAACGGKGTCGKCAVMVKAAGREAETVLACETFVIEDIEVKPVNTDAGFEILTGFLTDGSAFEPRFELVEIKRGETGRSVSETLSKTINGAEVPLFIYRELSGLVNSSGGPAPEAAYLLTDEKRAVGVFYDKKITAYGAAIDIGTTTVGLLLVDLLTGETAASHSLINRQRKFGADVISRIQNSGGGNFDEMTRLIREDVEAGIKEMLKKTGAGPGDIYKLAVSGNTTMIQFFLGVRCDSHGRSPFKTTFTSLAEYGYDEIFGGGFLNCRVMITPGISSFVGSDIVAGLLLCKKTEDNFLLIDIGTNGEMALVKKDGIICTSTAAGPAFEGGNISCGTGSVPGAVSGVTYAGGKFELTTIGGAPPVGLCGTGAIDLLAVLLDNGTLDETGALDDIYEDGVELTDGIIFTQKDVREMQLAKSALRSGIECLLKASGASYGDITRVFVAGGFGFKINLDSAVKIGMLPEELKGKVIVAGNSSLGGCVKALAEKNSAREAAELAAGCAEINLSEDKLFNQLFMEHMYF